MKSKTILKSAKEIWNALQADGGLEPDGRDKEFAGRLLELLDSKAADIDKALTGTTTDRFLDCFFHAMQPFTEMFRDILAYYKAAGARRGRHQLNVSIEEQHIELEDFEDFLQLWDGVPGELDVPAVDHETIGVHRLAWEAVAPLNNQAFEAVRGKLTTGTREVDEWLVRYRDGELSMPPLSLWQEQQEPGFKELAAVGVAVTEVLLQAAARREDLWGFPATSLEDVDPMSPAFVRFLETDRWLGTLVAGLALAGRLSDSERFRIAGVLTDKLSGLPVRKLRARVSFGDLLRFLSLPVWKKRHELYAVWIFTEILDAADEHEVSLHHSDGRITFEFRETLLAAITSTRPNLNVFSEKKVALDDPVGRGRTGNVQPDYSIWQNGRAASNECTLVVEVKHYKRTANRSFTDVLIDYAAAHPMAQVVLVNYGPIGDIIGRLPHAAGSRCHVIGNLNPLARGQRAQFRAIVEDVLGDPHLAAISVDGSTRARAAIAVDVSMSMRPALSDPSTDEIIASMISGTIASEIYPIDMKLHQPVSIGGARTNLARLTREPNHLSTPVSQLLGTYEEIIVLTDADGLNDLKDLEGIVEPIDEAGLYKVRVRR